ncbi:alpha/beta hydrolase [Pseudoalteromonas luteoviolacea]|uniref:alpha/beta hydrolase n=1 Tax=Pseudoalteromonas luteoviolacea TaxID=43657 RepID=UPI001B35FFF4|nr:alpha/beta hydrolase [Pseudoalteromonas luteoviolacea]MBQ4810359.1 alpha/beta hydrolase [Pseudoalteromonas luteoviolacea]
MRLVFLPGMDGTGILFEPIKKCIAESCSYEVVTLSSLSSNNPKEQAVEIAEQFKSEEIVIFAESYSGLIAYELCQLSGVTVKHVFFAASFLSRPSLLAKFSALIPLSMMRHRIVPFAILSYLLFGSANRTELVKLFYKALDNVSNKALKERLKIIRRAIEPVEKIQQPTTYLNASADYLVNKKVISAFKRVCLELNVVNIQGGHFIAQSNPEKCWQEVSRIIES